MVIEYIGEVIRTELAETREKQYEAKVRWFILNIIYLRKISCLENF